jgi:hypothetical protein
MKLHIKAAWSVLFKGYPTTDTLARINAGHWKRIRELEKQQGVAKEAVKAMVKPECLIGDGDGE